MKFETWLESKGRQVFVYHASPESGLYVIRPHGKKKGTHSRQQSKSGIYVAPRFKDAVKWVTSYIAWKKGSFDAPRSWKKDPEKPDKIHHESPMYYQNFTIYKLRVPKEVLERSWGSSWWEKEYFIIDDDLPTLEIVSSKTFTLQELKDIDRRQVYRSHEHRSARGEPFQIAKKLKQTNLAAKEWLRLTDILVKRVFQGINKDRKERASELLRNQLPRFFVGDWWQEEPPKERLTPEQEEQVKAIVKQIENLLK